MENVGFRGGTGSYQGGKAGGCDFSSHAGDIGINSKIDPESAVLGCCGADALEGAGIE